MTEVQSLDDLKAENAVAEVETEEVAEIDEGIETPEVDESAEVEEEQPPEEVTEKWLQTEGEEESKDRERGELKFTDSDVAKAKKKYAAKMSARLERDHETQIAELQSKIKELENRAVTPATSTQAPVVHVPKLSDFDYDEDRFNSAMASWHHDRAMQEAQAQTQKFEQERKLKTLQAARQENVEAHYERAAKLIESANISAETYQNADRNVREVFDSVTPGNGDAATDHAISLLGEDSEKVMYYIGRNQQVQETLRQKLLQDPNGHAATVYLGKLAAEIVLPSKRKSTAPKPAPVLDGKKPSKSGEADRQRYLRAHKNNDLQEAIAIKMAAKAKGVDTTTW